jgi:hypothetical protein
MSDLDGVGIRFLAPEEGGLLSEAIRVAYGETYDAAWCYDATEVGRRIADGRFISCVAEDADGTLLCHAGLSRITHRDLVGHAGQAITVPAARGHHLFTQVKRALAQWGGSHGMAGMYSEATAAHPYSELANVQLGAHETGFLLGWIPASVANDAVSAVPVGRQSAVLFYLKMNPGHTRPVYVPDRHRDAVHQIIQLCGLRGRLAQPSSHLRLSSHSHVHTAVHADHNLAVLTVAEPGADLLATVGAIRRRLFDQGVAVIYLDLPLVAPATAQVAGHLEDLGVSFSGIFPNTRADGDVLRMQSLNGITVTTDDVAVASDHGKDLLAYVLNDLITAAS